MMFRSRERTIVTMAIGAAVITIAACLLLFLTAKPTCCTEDLTSNQIERISIAAKNGDVSAMKRLFFFFDERSMRGDSEKADFWLKMAADAGDGQAEVFMYYKLKDSGRAEARQQGIKYLIDAAKRGDESAKQIVVELKTSHP